MKIKKFNESVEEDVVKKPTQIKVKHIIEYLNQFDPEANVGLDKDGWMAEFTPHKDELDLIDKRGIFHYWKERKHLTINN